MKQRPEYRICFYSAFSGLYPGVGERINELYSSGIDSDFLIYCARALDVSGLLYDEALKAGIDDPILLDKLRRCFAADFAQTASMLTLYDEISGLLGKNGITFMPLKGCDPRISSGSRPILNPMEDIDILVHPEVFDAASETLLTNGYRFQGEFSDSHRTFFSDEEQPRFIEIHRDVINRGNPIHNRLFPVPLENIWRRSSIRKNGERLMSSGDLLSYSAAHAVKEYFHKPKWIADCAWLIGHTLDNAQTYTVSALAREWGVANALGIIAFGIEQLIPAAGARRIFESGIATPGYIGRLLGNNLASYSRLRHLRPVIFIAAAEGFSGKTGQISSIARKLLTM